MTWTEPKEEGANPYGARRRCETCGDWFLTLDHPEGATECHGCNDENKEEKDDG